VSTSPNTGLALADQQITETEAHIAHHQRLIGRAGSSIEWAAQAQGPLQTMQEVLGRIREHRARIQPRLRPLPGGPSS
jgi:hypothetical protein